MLNTDSKLIYVKETAETPRILLDASRMLVDIRGRVISDSNNKIISHVQDWISKNEKQFEKGINLNISLEYFNTYNSKTILDLFKQTESIFLKSKNAVINWVYEKDDEDLLEAGEDYQAIVNVPFKFIGLDEPLEKDDTYYQNLEELNQTIKLQPLILDINKELLSYIAKHPDFLYKISSRKFEELVADILKDFGYDVELTKITRDGGRDIVAHIRNSITNIMMFVECKHFAENRPVGVDIIRQVIGVKELYKPNKSLIVTSSYFTKDAIRERSLLESHLDLKDHTDIKKWLQKYK